MTTMVKKLLLLLLFITAPSKVWAQSTLIYNVKGYTINDGKLVQFKALQFNGDTIEKLYQEQPSPITVAKLNAIDGNGSSLLPGLIDAHGHVLSYGKSLLSVNLMGSKSEHEAVKRVRKFVEDNGSQSWIRGRGWNQVLWPSKSYPNASALDKYFPDTPVALGRVDGHAIWLNSKAMALAGITKATKSPAGGEIIKDKHGMPTGVLIDNAMDLVYQVIPELSPKELQQVLVTSMNSLASYGLTSVHDAGVSVANINAYKELAANNAMPIRVNAMLSVVDPQWLKELAQGHFATDDGIFKVDSVKISSDGALGSRGAALFSDYSDLHGHTGLMLYSEDELYALIDTAMKGDFQVNTHAIGDKANHVVLNHYQTAMKKYQSKERRHRIEHAQVIAIKDIPRFHQLNVIPSMQATHATSDMNMAEDRLGKARLKGAYAWNTLLKGGNIIANGSDFPVEHPNPFYGLHAAITRQDKDNQPLNGWIIEESMTPIQALKSFTIDAAFAGHQENIIGSLEAGKKADFILVDKDMFTQPATSIWQNKVLATWVNGKQVFKRQH